ncbi:MAG: N-acetylmuramoyl-L-alanine amidase, partial [Planctomycetota bacterium]
APERTRRAGEIAGSRLTISPNQSGRAGQAPRIVVIHSCEGAYSGCWSWLANRRSRASAHYVINEDGTKIRQLVRESRKAWHVRANYRHHLNVGEDDPDPAASLAAQNGRGTNDFSIGIEHAGRASQTHWDEGLIDTSARAVCEITRRYDIPVDRFHILPHGQLQPENRTDPGPNWPWDDYMRRIEDYRARDCDLPPLPPEGLAGAFTAIIDSRRSANPEHTSLTVPPGWGASTGGRDFFNTGWWRRSARDRDETVAFGFRLAEAARVSVEVWWPREFSGATSVPVTIEPTGGDPIAELTVDMSTGGGAWAEVGTFDLSEGLHEVGISARTDEPGRFIAADAVRIRAVTPEPE